MIAACGTTEPRADLGFVQVSAGNDTTCARTVAGAAYCWRNSLTGTMTTQGTPVPVPGALTFRSLSAGFHTCGVTTAGAVYCWGANRYGELGIGAADTLPHATPAAVVGGFTFAAVSVGWGHTCGVATGGAVYCWGDNRYGELGIGVADTLPHATPVAVVGGPSFATVSAGVYHTCGMTTGGAAYCWGDNGGGELGNGSQTSSFTPVAVAGGLSFAAVSAGSSRSCGVTSAGAAYCWGWNTLGQLGNGSYDTLPHPAPVPVAGGLTFRSVSVGGSGTCGVTTGGAAYCWGYNLYDLLGDGRTTSSLIPAAVAGGFTFEAVSAGVDHNCGITHAGVIHCWGAYVS